MIALSVSDVTLSFGAEKILEGVSFSVNDGDKLGVVGVNGAGKTSLLKIIAGIYEADTGAVYIQKGHTVGLLEQNPDLSALPSEMAVLEYMYTPFPELLKKEAELSRLEALISQSAAEGKESEAVRLAAKLAEETKSFSEAGGLEFRGRCRSALLRLGFD